MNEANNALKLLCVIVFVLGFLACFTLADIVEELKKLNRRADQEKTPR